MRSAGARSRFDSIKVDHNKYDAVNTEGITTENNGFLKSLEGAPSGRATAAPLTELGRRLAGYTDKNMNFIFKMMDFASKMLDFVFQMLDFGRLEPWPADVAPLLLAYKEASGDYYTQSIPTVQPSQVTMCYFRRAVFDRKLQSHTFPVMG